MASNISVAITVDNKQYIANIKAADATTQKFASNTTKSLNNINLVSDNLISRIGGLKTAIAGLVSATAIQQANNFANAVKDIATTTDISIETILGLSRAFEVNGGTAEGAQNSLLKFSEAVAAARSGNDSALKSFKEIGITIDDLNKNGIEQLTKKSIAGIAGLSSAAAQIRTQTDLFGKAAKGVSFGGVQQTTQAQYISPETVSALKSGADASENMKKQFGQLTDALLRVAQPLNDIVKNVNITVTAFESLVKAVLAAVAAFALFKGISMINGLLGGMAAAATATGGVLAWFGLQFGIIVNSLKYFILNLGRAIGLLPTAYGGLTSVGFALGALAKGFLRLAGVVGIIYTVIEAINFLSKVIFNFSPVDYLIEKFNGLLKVAKEYLGLKPSEAPGAGAGRGGNAETLKAQQEQGEKMKKAWDEQQQAIADYKDRVSKLAVEIRKIGDSYAYNNDQQLQTLALDARLIGASEDKIELARTLADLYKKEGDTIKQLLETRAQWAKGTEEQKANLGIIDAEIAKVKKLTAEQATNIEEYVGRVQKARKIEEDRLYFIDLQTKAMNSILDIEMAIAGFSMSEDERKIAAIQRQIKLEEDAAVKREQLKAGKEPIGAEKEAEIREKVRKSMEGQLDVQVKLNAATKEENARLFLLDLQNTAMTNAITLQGELAKLTMTADQQRIHDLRTQNELLVAQEVAKRKALLKPGENISASEIAQISAQVTAANEALIASTQALINKGREFSTGWEQAFIKYKDDAENAASQSKTYFDTFTRGFEDAFVKLVQTGKLSFKDLANSLIADFARIQAKKALLGIFDMGGGNSSGGGFSFGTLFKGIGSIFGFANGGIPPVGQPSIVGERGPELFVPQSAGRIIPNDKLGGMGSQTQVINTAVTYSIQAVDASSFRTLVARDPEFIHNVAEQGRRQLPIRSRR